jgi:hypothetical protein
LLSLFALLSQQTYNSTNNKQSLTTITSPLRRAKAKSFTQAQTTTHDMKGDNTFVQNQYGQDQVHPQHAAPGYNDTPRAYGQQQPQAYGAVGNMGAPQGHHQQQAGGQPIYVVDGHNSNQRGGDNGEHSLDCVLAVY